MLKPRDDLVKVEFSEMASKALIMLLAELVSMTPWDKMRWMDMKEEAIIAACLVSRPNKKGWRRAPQFCFKSL